MCHQHFYSCNCGYIFMGPLCFQHVSTSTNAPGVWVFFISKWLAPMLAGTHSSNCRLQDWMSTACCSLLPNTDPIRTISLLLRTPSKYKLRATGDIIRIRWKKKVFLLEIETSSHGNFTRQSMTQKINESCLLANSRSARARRAPSKYAT